VAILAEVQAGRPTIIHKDGGEMLIAIVVDRPLAEAKALVDDPAAFTREMTRILREKQKHSLIAQMMKPAESGDPPPPIPQPVAPVAVVATARKTSFVWISYDVDVFLLIAGSESVHSCSSVYPGFGSMYCRFHTAWWDH